METQLIQIAPAIVNSAAALIGVVLGGFLTNYREQNKEKKQLKRDSVYLAAVVGARLEELVDDCVSVLNERVEVDIQGYNRSTVPCVKFTLSELDVNWKAIPPELLYEILSLPYRVKHQNQQLEEISENSDAPEYSEYFEGKYRLHAYLAKDASDIARKLRLNAKLPEQPYADNRWDRSAFIDDCIQKSDRRCRRDLESSP